MIRNAHSSFILRVTLAAALLATVGAGCDKKKEGGTAPAPAGATGAKSGAAAPSAIPDKATTAPPAATPPAAPAPAAGGADMSDPTKVVEAMFAAAASGKTDQLASLCDPKGSGDGDVKDVCGVTKDGPKYGEFVEYFAKGAVKGPARVTGDTAEVDFLFGPDGKKDETMKLAKIDGKWYLASF